MHKPFIYLKLLKMSTVNVITLFTILINSDICKSEHNTLDDSVKHSIHLQNQIYISDIYIYIYICKNVLHITMSQSKGIFLFCKYNNFSKIWINIYN